ncbi:MAG: hypothetical protein WC916_07035 [Candidatus Woesearchaeota archaeon]
MKKRFEYITWISIVLALVLIGIAPAVHAEIYNSSKPIIKVTYGEDPVTIDTYNLTHNSLPGFPFELYPPTPLNPALEFNFTTSYLLRGNYTFNICAHDADNNSICASKNFTINTSNDVWLTDPAPLGIGKTPIYNITFASKLNMNCRYQLNTTFQNASQLYKQAMLLGQTGTKDHRISNFVASGLQSPKLELLVCKLVDTPATSEDDLYYRIIYFYVGYDTTPPSIIVGARPNPVIDYARKYTTITAVSNDAVQCRIINNDPQLMIDQRFEETNPAEYIQYKKINKFLLNLTNRINDKSYRNIAYTIECNNTAQWQNSTTIAIEYNISENIGITQITDFSSVNNGFLYRIQTTLKAELCALSVNGDDVGSMTEIPGWDNNYTKVVNNLNEGNNSMQVTCRAAGAESDRTETFNLIVDNENPFLNITSTSPSCSVNEFLIQYITYDNTSGIASLNYVLTRGTTVVLKNNITVDENIYYWKELLINVTGKGIVANSVYTITVNATDKSGRVSPSLTKQITASSLTAPGCSVCNNKILETAEDCEYDASGNVYFRNNCTDLVNSASPTFEKYFGGKLRCDAKCKADKTNCEKSNNAGYCGDNKINNFFIEQCDGNPIDAGFDQLKSWGKVPTTLNEGCRILGFTGGTLTCNAPWTPNQCEFNTSACTSPNSDASCKDYLLEAGEQCEFNNPFKNYAPNHITNCTDFDGFDGGNLKCTGSCRFDLTNCTRPEVCGDSVVISGGKEECEPGGAIKGCYNQYPKLYASGNLSCNPKGSVNVSGLSNECKWNVSACTDLPICNNGIKEPGEICDATSFGDTSCKTRTYRDATGIHTYTDGLLGCSANCQAIIESNCQKEGQNGYCGDGVVNNYFTEQCDGNPGDPKFNQLNNWGKITGCQDLGFGNGGTLSCNKPYSAQQCQFNTSGCENKLSSSNTGCTGSGNTYITKGEQCQDGIPFNFATFYMKELKCTDFATFVGGNLSCNGCALDLSKCFAGCGDGNLNKDGGETCEKGDTPRCKEELNSTRYASGTATCNDDCTGWNTASCIKRNPDIIIQTPLLTCSLKNFTFTATINQTGNPIIRINYSINMTGEPAKKYMYDINTDENPHTRDITTTLIGSDMLSKGKYTLNVYAIDAEGKISAVQNKLFDVTEENHPLCEKDPPVIQLNTQIIQAGYAVAATLNCTDASGCAENYYYKFIKTNETCNQTPSYNYPEKYANQPLIINAITLANQESMRICIKAPDKIGNTAYTDKIITLIVPKCANGLFEGDEQCEFNSTNGQIQIKDNQACTNFEYDPGSVYGMKKGGTGKFYTGGILGCTPTDCKLIYDNCDYGRGYCGDSKTNDYYYETCDGDKSTGSWGKITSCQNLGFSGGTPTCNAPFSTKQCQFNTSDCTGSFFSNKDKGNGEMDPGEQCDPGKNPSTYPHQMQCNWFDNFINGTVTCKDTAMFDITQCKGEAFCGDGTVDKPNANNIYEQCDYGKTQTARCKEDINSTLYESGTTNICTSACNWDTSTCTPAAPVLQLRPMTQTCGLNEFNFEYIITSATIENSIAYAIYEGSTLIDRNSKTVSSTNKFRPLTIKLSSSDKLTEGKTYTLTAYAINSFGKNSLNQTLGLKATEKKSDGCSICGNAESSTDITGFEECDYNNNTGKMYFGSTRCENLNLNGKTYAGGTLSCDSTCKFDERNCEIDIGKGYCGDNKTNNYFNEQCDGDSPSKGDWGTIRTCADLGFDNGGTLSCNKPYTPNQCQLNTGKCIKQTKPLAVCNDNYISPGEQCDAPSVTFASYGLHCTDFDSFVGGNLSCSACKLDLSKCIVPTVCGDTIRAGNEQCDVNMTSPCVSWDQAKYVGGNLSCNPQGSANACKWNTAQCIEKASCGNGKTETGNNEQCDGIDLGNAKCASFYGFTSGTLSCHPSSYADTSKRCTYNTQNCDSGFGFCGNGRIDSYFNEQCDGSDFGKVVKGSAGCKAFGFTGGTLTCNAPYSLNQCQFNTAGCTSPITTTPQCGGTNPILNPGEQCENAIPLAINCTQFDSFTGGTLACTAASCMYDISKCTPQNNTLIANKTSCGNGIIEPQEQCEGITVMNKESWKKQLNCNGDIICSSCIIRCGAMLPHCQNKIKDGDEVNIDCGGADCSGCALNQSCIKNADCDSENCQNQKCTIHPCKNTIKDGNETDVDCGGSCTTKCTVSKTCSKNSDCASNNCEAGKCAPGLCENNKRDSGETAIDCGGPLCDACPIGDKLPNPPQTTGFILLLIGILFILGGGGYIIYKTFIEKKSVHGQSFGGMNQGYNNAGYGTGSVPLTPQAREMQRQMQIAQTEHEHQRMMQIRKKMEEKKFQKEQERSSVLDKLDDEKTKKALEEAQKKAKEKDTTTSTVTDYVDMDTLTKEVGRKDEAKKIAGKTIAQSKANDAFSKLSTMSRKKSKGTTGTEKSSDGYVELTTDQDTGKTSAKTTESTQKSVFDELKAATTPLNRDQVKAQLAELSGKGGKKVDKKIDGVLDANIISAVDADRLFTGLTREKLTSDLFKTILSSLVTSGKLSKRDVTNLLFEYMDSGTLTKKDVAKITTELKLT